MSRSLALLGSLVALVCLVGSAGAQRRDSDFDRSWVQSPLVPPVLKNAIRRGGHARYVGRRTVEFWRSPKDLKHEEIVTRDGNRSRVEFPDGSRFAGRIYVENGHERREYHPETNEIWVLPARHEESEMRLAHLADRGAEGKVVFTTAPGIRVAGYPTDQVVVSDSHGNIVQRLYIEPNSGVLLRREVFDPGGAKIGMFEFTEIDLDPPAFDPSLFRFDRRDARLVTPYDRLRELANQEHFPALALPPASGFRLDEVRVARIQGERVLVESYSSHQGKLSLFELKTDLDSDRLRQFARGTELHAYSWRVGAGTLVLVGSQDSNFLERLASAVVGTR